MSFLKNSLSINLIRDSMYIRCRKHMSRSYSRKFPMNGGCWIRKEFLLKWGKRANGWNWTRITSRVVRTTTVRAWSTQFHIFGGVCKTGRTKVGIVGFFKYYRMDFFELPNTFNVNPTWTTLASGPFVLRVSIFFFVVNIHTVGTILVFVIFQTTSIAQNYASVKDGGKPSFSPLRCFGSSTMFATLLEMTDQVSSNHDVRGGRTLHNWGL